MERASKRPEMSRAETLSGKPAASASTSGGNVSERLYFTKIALYSAIGVWLTPKSSTISPVGFICR